MALGDHFFEPATASGKCLDSRRLAGACQSQSSYGFYGLRLPYYGLIIESILRRSGAMQSESSFAQLTRSCSLFRGRLACGAPCIVVISCANCQCLRDLTFRSLINNYSRFLSHTIHKRIFNPTFLPAVLRTVRATLFPNNALGPQRQPPSDDEARKIKRRCATSVLKLIPPKLASIYFATRDRGTQLAHVEEVLSCLDDAYINKHLIFQIVELIILRLVPELGKQGVRELMEERSVDVHADLPMQSSSLPSNK